RQFIERLNATHVIVRRFEPAYGDLYYLYTRAEALGLIAHAADEVPLIEIDAFDLHESGATPVVDEYADTSTVPDRCVVVEKSRVVGFVDETELRVAFRDGILPEPSPVFPTRKRRRVTRGVRGEPKEAELPEAEPPEAEPPESRSLVADFPAEVPLEETASLIVSLSAEPERPEGRDSLPVPSLPPDSTIDIVVVPKRGFELVGKSEGTVVIGAAEETLPVQFKLKATKMGPGKVVVFAFHEGQSLGNLRVVSTVVPAGQAVDERRSRHEQRMADVEVRTPDFRLHIIEDRNGTVEYKLYLHAADPKLGLTFTPFGSLELRTDPPQYFREFFQDIEDLELNSRKQRAAAEQHLAAKGSLLFDRLLPPNVQDLLWKHRDSVRTVVVESEEPWIPWELCKLQGKENGKVVEGPFMCEAFAMTRWISREGHQREFTQELNLKKMAVVTPGDSGLEMASNERDYVLSLANGGRTVEPIPANSLNVIDALAKGEYDGWHFTGHGGFDSPDPNRSAILLEGGEELTPENLSGAVKNLGLAKPLVFLNACQVGRSAMSLTGIGGWAEQFLDAGAAAFIGAYWSVYDQPAHDFCEAFYRRLLAGTPIGQAVQEARAEIKPLGDPTWLAYTVFANPWATVQP
ncbi:MAG: CHAT domain-containing protein, partial [Candidatus Coatesbacteria bacterium]